MSNLSKLTIRKTTVAILTLLLVIAIAAPLATFAAAAGAPTASLGKASGPNGTIISVSGTGFGVSEAVGAISVSVDGHPAGQNVVTTSVGLSTTAPMSPAAIIPVATAFAPTSQLNTDSTGKLSGNIILYGLALGAHTVIISDATTNVVAGTFTVTAPSVTVTPATAPAGTSVTVSGSGFPVSAALSPWYTNAISASSFAGTTISVASGKNTANPNQLSSNVIGGSGSYSGTVSLPAVTTGSAFTLTDAWGNIATTTLSLGTPTVTLTPSSGPAGTVVTVTVAGFGPGATFSTVAVGNLATTSSAAVLPTGAKVTEQGTASFVFTMPVGTTTDKAGVAGAQAVKVTDSLGNVATATFTVTPKVTLALGASGVNSGTTIAPASTASAQIFVTVTGLKASAELTFAASPNIPTAWKVPTATWGVTTGSYSATTGKISTDANGVATFVSDMASTPAQAGQYSITIGDGTTSLSTIVTITTTGNIIAVTNGAGTSSGAKGSAVTVTYFGTAPGNILFGSSGTFAAVGAVQTWPTATTNKVTFTVPASAASGLNTVAASNLGFNSVPYTVIAPAITVVSPSSASVGTTVTIVGSGFAGTTALLSIQGGSVTPATSDPATDTLIATFAVPNYIPGSYTLTLSDGINTASTSLEVAAASVQITPTSGTPTNSQGNGITIGLTNGAGFKAGDALTVYFDSTPITASTTAATGLTVVNTNGGILIDSGFKIDPATCTITAGTHTITVVGASGAYATATYSVTPKLASLAAVRPGANVVITGTGFSANSLQTLYINGSAATWLNTGVVPAVSLAYGTQVVTTAGGILYTTSSVGFVVSATQEPCTLNVTVADALGFSASTMLTVLGTPAITLGSANIVAGTIANGVTITGSGFTPGTGRAISVNLYNGDTLIPNAITSAATVTIGDDGKFPTGFSTYTFKVAGTVIAGTYTLRFATTTAPLETADATITVLGAPAITAPTSAASGSNVTITINGLSSITAASFSSKTLVSTAGTPPVTSITQIGGKDQFGPLTIKSSGATAFTTTTSFIVPTDLFYGTYLLTVTDASTGLSVQAAITVTPTMTIALPASGAKGTALTVSATGFAATSVLTAKVNGAAVTLSAATTDAAGAFTGATFLIPITATATNTLTVTDAAGNTASATFTLTTPTIVLSATEAQVGNTVQIIGNGFTANSPIVIQVAGQIVTTTPAALTASNNAAGSFIGYFAVPAGLSGNITITATDNSNNVATVYLTVGGGQTNPTTPDQTTMTSTAQTTTSSGTATTTFTAGSTVKAGFVLQTVSGSRDVVVAVTWQQGATVYNMASFQTTMDTTARTVSFSNLAPVGATGTWTATLQVFAIDGVTPLGVTTLTFTVS